MNTLTTDDSLPALGEAGHFSASQVQVRAERILRIQGYAEPQRVRPRIRKAAEFSASLAEELAAGEVGFRHLPITRLEQNLLELDRKHTFHCEAFGRYLGGCDAVVVFVLTAGAEFDTRIDEFMHGDQPVEGLFLDSAGWLVVEAVTRQFADQLKGWLNTNGARLTRRMGPGYSYKVGTRMEPWDLTQQTELFAALADAPLPSKLLESSAMHPKMSRSGLYGLKRTSSIAA